MKKLFLVTGACGHVGNTVVKLLQKKGHAVRALALKGEDTRSLAGAGVEIFSGDVCDRASLSAFFETLPGYETVVIHCAGIISIAGAFDQRVVDVNVGGTKNILDECLERGVARLVYVSSVHAIPEGNGKEQIVEIKDFAPEKVRGLYAKTKSMATALVMQAQKLGLDAVIVHPSGIIGPGDYAGGHMTQLVEDYLNGALSACVAGGYDFVDVRDVADGIVAAALKGRRGEGYILSNRFVSVKELLTTLQEITGLQKIRCQLPRWFVNMVAPLAEGYYKLRKAKPLFTRYSVSTLVSNANISHAKAAAELGYAPRDIRETIRDTVEFLKTQGRIKKKRLLRMKKGLSGAAL